VATLTGWKERKLVCPLESGQPKPALEQLQAPFAHAKLTSGSTGGPRVVLFRGEQLEADARQIISTMGLRPEWPNLGVISLAHSYGFSNLVTPLLLFGIPLILAPAPFPELIHKICREAGAVTLPAVPALWKIWHDAGSIPEGVKLAISAGAPLPLQLEQEVFSKWRLKIHNFYGASECGGIAYDRSETPRCDQRLAGAAMDGVVVTRTETGLLTIASPAVGETYWPQPSESLANGIFQATDLVDLNGTEILLTGRATDLINVAGRKVAPETIEAAIRNHPDIEHVLVFGIPSAGEERGEEIVACFKCQSQKHDLAQIKNFVSRQLPAWQMPRAWWHEETLTVNARGKISRAEWRNKFLEQGRK
ncbi:MAG: class I adenylate-forming enzyme family protein, partial [Verrucomicrobiales bacterium]